MIPRARGRRQRTLANGRWLLIESGGMAKGFDSQRPVGNFLPITWVGWSAALLPLIVVHAVFLISVGNGHLGACNPYWDGCTSISRVARQPETVYLFRATMLPYAALLMLFWGLSYGWCRAIVPALVRRRNAMLGFGLVGAAFLVLYVTFLGESGEMARWMRRYGINVFFAFTVLAQMLLASQVFRHPHLPRALWHAWWIVCALLIGVGVASLPLQYLVEDRSALLNALEWQYALLMILAYPLTAWCWRRTGYTVSVSATPMTGDPGRGP